MVTPVTFFKETTDKISLINKREGQLIYDIITGETFIDCYVKGQLERVPLTNHTDIKKIYEYLQTLPGKIDHEPGGEIFNNYQKHQGEDGEEVPPNSATGDYSHAEGDETKASGSAAHSEGHKTIALGNASHAEGQESKSSGVNSHAEGSRRDIEGNDLPDLIITTDITGLTEDMTIEGTESYGVNSHAEGTQTLAFGHSAHSEGYQTESIGAYSHAEGYQNISIGINSHSEGSENKTTGIASHSEGWKTQAIGDISHTEGNTTQATGENSHAEGKQTEAVGINAHSEGFNTFAYGMNSHSEGANPEGNVQGIINVQSCTQEKNIYGNFETAITCQVPLQDCIFEEDQYSQSKVVGFLIQEQRFDKYSSFKYQDNVFCLDTFYSESVSVEDDPQIIHMRTPTIFDFPEGDIDITIIRQGSLGDSSHAEGRETIASGLSAHAEGKETNASGDYSHAEGHMTIASDNGAHAEGYKAIASGDHSHAEGYKTTASDDNAHAEGYMTIASDDNTHAEGYKTTASDRAAHAEGKETTASGDYSHAEGYLTIASDRASHTEGRETIASENYTHAEGYKTKASSSSAHAEGSQTTASGGNAHTEGYMTVASGQSAHAEGRGSLAEGEAQHSQGKYNIRDTLNKYAHIVGNGTDNEHRSNAHTIDWDGNAWYKGHLYTGSASQEDALDINLEIDKKFNKAGDTMSGDIDMNYNYINNLPEASTPDQPVPLSQLEAKIASLGAVLNYKGTKALFTDLPTTGNKIGDVWYVEEKIEEETASEYVWVQISPTEEKWEKLGPTLDLSGYLEKSKLLSTLGPAIDNTMSQKAITDELNKKADNNLGIKQSAPNQFVVVDTVSETNIPLTFKSITIPRVEDTTF